MCNKQQEYADFGLLQEGLILGARMAAVFSFLKFVNFAKINVFCEIVKIIISTGPWQLQKGVTFWHQIWPLSSGFSFSKKLKNLPSYSFRTKKLWFLSSKIGFV